MHRQRAHVAPRCATCAAAAFGAGSLLLLCFATSLGAAKAASINTGMRAGASLVAQARARGFDELEPVQRMLQFRATGNNITSGRASKQQTQLDGASWHAFELSFATNAAIGFICAVTFTALHLRYPDVYRPRLRCESAAQMAAFRRRRGSRCESFAWIARTLRLTDERIFRDAGLDALSLVKVVELAMELFTIFMVLNTTFLIFILQRWSMEQVKGGSGKLWAHFSCACLTVGCAMYLIHRHWRDFSSFRVRYLRSLRDAAGADGSIPALALHGRTVLAEQLPDSVLEATDPDGALMQLFEGLFPGQVDSALVARNPGGALRRAVARRDRAVEALEAAIAADATRLPEDPPRSYRRSKKSGITCGRLPCCAPCFGDVVENAVDGRREELAEAESELREAITRAGPAKPYSRGVGFVVFRTAAAATLASQSLLDHPGSGPVVSPAPEPRDLRHESLGSSKLRVCGISLRSTLGACVATFLVLFWAVPVAAFNAMTQLDNLEKYLKFLKPVLKNRTLRGYLEGFLPTLGVLIFMAVLPRVLAALARGEGAVSHSAVDASASFRFCWFQVVNVLLVSALAGGVAETLSAIIDRPGELIHLLASSIPGTYFFFVNYVALLTFSVYPLELLLVGSVFSKRKGMEGTSSSGESATARVRRLGPPPITSGYAKQFGYVLIVIAVSLMFSTISPLVLPFSVLFFGIGGIVLRHHVYYVYANPYEGGGKLWSLMMGVIIAVIILVELTLTGVFYAKGAPTQASLMWVMIIATGLFWRYESNIHRRAFRHLPVSDLQCESENPLLGVDVEVKVPADRLSVRVGCRSYAYAVRSHADPRRAPTDEELVQERPALEGPAALLYEDPVLVAARWEHVQPLPPPQSRAPMDEAGAVARLRDVLPLAASPLKDDSEIEAEELHFCPIGSCRSRAAIYATALSLSLVYIFALVLYEHATDSSQAPASF